MGDLGLLLFVLLHPFLIAAFFFHRVEAVIAGVKLRFAVFDLNDPVHGAVQKVAVMGDGHHGAPEFLDIGLQPLRSVKVQMVGRLIQQQNVRILQNQAAQVHPGLFSAGKLVEQPAPHIVRNGQAVGHLADGHIRIVSAEHLKPLGKTAIALQNGRVRLHRRHAARQFFHFSGQGVESPEGRAQHIVHGVPRRIHWDLGDQTHPVTRRNGDGALVAVQFSYQYFEQRGLAGAVFAQQAHPLPLIDLKGDAIQNIVAHLKGFYKVVDLNLNHNTSASPPSAAQNAWSVTP